MTEKWKYLIENARKNDRFMNEFDRYNKQKNLYT